MGIVRQNPYLSEIIEILDAHRAKYRSDAEAIANLSAEDSAWIDNELVTCMSDRRYFISNYYAYRDEKEGFKGLYPLFDSQEILCETYRQLEAKYGKVRALVLKARQMGSTTYNCAEFFAATIFAEHINSIIVGPDEDTSGYVMGMYESALDFLPWWMRPRKKTHHRGSKIEFDEFDEAIRVTRPGLKSWIYADNARKPSGVGRGKTFGRCLMTELAFWENGSQLSKALFPTMNTPDGFYIMESTANGRNDFWHNLWRRAEAGKVDWHPVFIPFYRREATYSLPIPKGEVFELTEDEKLMRQNVLERDGFLIKDETFNWARNKKEEFVATDGDDMMFSQEYTSTPEESFQSSAPTAVPRGIINRFSKRTVPPVLIGEIDYDFHGGKPKPKLRPWNQDFLPNDFEDRLQVWEKPAPGEIYVVGVDVSLGNPGGDYSDIEVVKIGSGHQLDEQVASWHGLTDPDTLAEYVLALGWWYNEAMVAVEVNSMGMLTNNTLLRQYEYENIYRFKRLDRLKHFMTDIVGWWTDDKSKRALLAGLTKRMRDDLVLIRDRWLIDDLRDLTDEGRAEGEGAHDDRPMAFMIALYCAHELEAGEARPGPPKVSETAHTYRVMDRWGTEIMKTHSRNEAERMSKKFPGSSIQRLSGTTALLPVAGLGTFKVPGDFQNTAHSPVHDRSDSPQARMYDQGYDPEDTLPEQVAEFMEMEEASADDPNAWKWQ